MDKKDIYEHLAKIYLDASQKSHPRKGRRGKQPSKLFKNLFFVSLALVVILSGLLAFSAYQKPSLNSRLALVLKPDVAVLNFSFGPVKKEIFSIDLKGMDIARFRILSFDVRKKNYSDNVALRIEFTNAYQEKSEVYLKDISHKWKSYKINLSDFKKISDWSVMFALNFMIEEWNAKGERVLVYLDNVSLQR
ncbi:MAG: hypothetical protein AB1530_00195 [Candidatus Omnitrophota bacterium]